MKADNNKPNSLEDLFKSALEEANRADTGEPDLVWPELPDDLKNKPEETPEA